MTHAKHIRQILRRLSSALIASVILNALLIGYITYKHLEFDTPESVTFSVLEAFNTLSNLPQEELLSHLNDKRIIEDKIKIRDIALGVLVERDKFNVEKGLGYSPVSHTLKKDQLALPHFIKLTDRDFEILESFGNREKWPILPQRMLEILKRNLSPSLKEAFILTPHFQKLRYILSDVEIEDLFKLVLEGNWDTLNSSPTINDFETRQGLLINYLNQDSPTAAYLLLKLEPHLALQKLEDESVLKILKLLNKKDPLIAKFALNVLSSPRKEDVKNLAVERLTSFTGYASLQNPMPPFKAFKNHTVQQGDNLWKIAKHWKIPIRELKKANDLNDDTILQPGMLLKIPDKN